MKYAKLVNGVEIQMTEPEISQRKAEEAAWEAGREQKEKTKKRKDALAAEWPDAFALLDDILERGIPAVKTDREAIKSANPKGD